MQVVEIRTDHKAESPFANRKEGEEPVRLTFYLDGAHTEESMATCATWFADTVSGAEQAGQGASAPDGSAPETQRVLLFNCMQVRQCIVCELVLCHMCLTSLALPEH